ncbi:MAG: carbamoyltransferase C-terminal domain-containing protein [Cyanobacteriota bacterium]
MNILGLGYTQHECSAALVIDGILRTAIARERVSRIKRDGSAWGAAHLNMSSAITYCLNANGLELTDINLVVYNDYFHRSAEDFRQQLADAGGLDVLSLPSMPLPHHFAHACCSFYLSPFQEAAVFVTDGAGGAAELIARNCRGPEAESIAQGITIIQNIDIEPTERASEYESFYHVDADQWQSLRKTVGRSDGIGAVYGRASRLLFGDDLDCGKTMGLSSYATPAKEAMFLSKAGPRDMPFFRSDQPRDLQELEERIEHIVTTVRDASKYDNPELQVYAASLQKETEDALVDYARWLQTTTGSKHLCLSGGVALNCVANSRIWDEAGFEDVFVPPCPGDDGIAIGCALYGAALHGERVPNKMPVFGGCVYNHEPSELEALGLKRVFPDQNICEVIAKQLAQGAVIAWFQEGSEFGPRALGHRSFLADPRRAEMKDHLNLTVKNRENFRPFAPVVLEEHVLDYFEQHYPSHCMSFVSRVREEQKENLAAITHVDGTARYQVLRQDHHPQLHALIQAFAKESGIPIILNTSLNRAGEPLVETPREAAMCALQSSADFLVVDGVIYQPGESS